MVTLIKNKITSIKTDKIEKQTPIRKKEYALCN